MSNKIKEYSVVAHLIHSRLQLVRKKIRVNTLSDGKELAFENYYIFYRAGKSVKDQYGFRFTVPDMAAAGELFISTINEFEMKSYYVVQKKSGPTDRVDITTYDLGATISPADPSDRWSREEAIAIKDAIVNCHKIFGFHVVRIWGWK